MLRTRVFLLRVSGRLPAARTEIPAKITRIFYSFPYRTVGDSVLALACVARIHERWPSATIDVAVGSSVSELFSQIPYIDRVFQLPPPRSRSVTMAAYQDVASGTAIFRREIAHFTYDLAINSRWDSSDSYLAGHLVYLTGAPIRCGYSGSNDGGTSLNDGFYTHLAIGGASEHESLRHSRILARCHFELMDETDQDLPNKTNPLLIAFAERRRAQSIAHPAPVSGPYIVLAPMASHPRRNWPVRCFAELGRDLLQKYGLTSILIGGPADRKVCEDLRDAIGGPTTSMAGKTSLVETLDLISRATLFVGNDSGPAHLAGALGITSYVISPFPHSCTTDDVHSPKRFRPVGSSVYVIQPEKPLGPCTAACGWETAHCIVQVSTVEVLRCIEKTAMQVETRISRC